MEPSSDPPAGPGAARGWAPGTDGAGPLAGPVLVSWLEVLLADGLIRGVPDVRYGWQGGEPRSEP